MVLKKLQVNINQYIYGNKFNYNLSTKNKQFIGKIDILEINYDKYDDIDLSYVDINTIILSTSNNNKIQSNKNYILPKNLNKLIINSNIKNLSLLPSNLHSLQINNKYTSNHINQLPSNLKILQIKYKNTLYPILPNNLEELIIKKSTVMPDTLPNKLKIFSCEECNINKLPELPQTLEKLKCSKNRLEKLPDVLPLGLMELRCDNNLIIELPKLINLNKLEKLFCSNNRLLELPILPLKINTLDCSFNFIESLPNLIKYEFNYLNASNNLLTSFPKYSIIKILFISENRITKFFINNNLSYLNVDRNPLIYFPQLHNNMKICFRGIVEEIRGYDKLENIEFIDIIDHDKLTYENKFNSCINVIGYGKIYNLEMLNNYLSSR